ncbi:IAA-leucine resistant 2 [Mercurialis annua]|uniref:IAA-leucine resistant 2 n=1 Tax=Mercurialis annua TaxID=3986 RepID=UPI002160053C|nr:IAA-leucine resistant 2 [Mercurialis annua]
MNPLSKNIADGLKPEAGLEMLQAYKGVRINYEARKNVSTYVPSSLMMDHIVHLINSTLLDSFHFRRACPDYHPYILRLYYAVLFIIQVMRASRHANILSAEGSQTLSYLLDVFPPESLPVSGPLLELFKTLCCSQPENPTYGLVSPRLPIPLGPATRRDFMLTAAEHHIIPNIPGIMALIADLNDKINPASDNQAVYPAKGKHIPVSSTATSATVFGHHSFGAAATRTTAYKWSLCSSGLQYPCEADEKLHEEFAERLDSFDFPATAETDVLSSFNGFLHVSKSQNWFANVRAVAADVAPFFEGSGTLADCPPFGLPINQIVVKYAAPEHAPAEPAGLFRFAFSLKTTCRSLPELAEAMASLAQTNVDFPENHLLLSSVDARNRIGPFWSIRPIESSIIDDSSYLSLGLVVKSLFKPQG